MNAPWSLFTVLASTLSAAKVGTMPARNFFVLIGLASLMPLSGLAATEPIYKCIDANLRVAYTDVPCRNGEQLDIRAGEADPAAVARLQRERDRLDQSTAQRIADQQRQRDTAARYTADDYRPDYGLPAYDYGGVGWLPGVARPHPQKARAPKVHGPRRIAPMAPSIELPRR